MARPALVDGQDIGVLYRTAVETGQTLDGLPLYAAAFPCAIKSAIVGCCKSEMPTTLTFTITPASGQGSPYTVTATWGEWYGGGYYFWQYVASPYPTVSGQLISLDFYCFASSGGSASFEVIMKFFVIPGPPFAPDPQEITIVVGPFTIACCNGVPGSFFVFDHTFQSPFSTLASSGTTWRVSTLVSCDPTVIVDHHSYWPALDTGKTLDGYPLWAAADCISDNGVTSGSTTWPFDAMEVATARALYRFATPTGKHLDGVPLFAAENDPCCDGGGLNPGYGGNVVVQCWSIPVSTKLYLTVEQTPAPPWPTPPPFTIELNYSTDPNAGYANVGWSGTAYLNCIAVGSYPAQGFWWGTIGEKTFYLFPCIDTFGAWMLAQAICGDFSLLHAACVRMMGSGGGPMYLYQADPTLIPGFCIPGYNGFGRFNINVTE